MTASLIITLRETLEASLVVGIVLSYLHLVQQQDHDKWVWRGVYAGAGASIVLALLFNWFLGGFTGRAEEIYEGVIMLAAAGLITWMILWMLKQKQYMRKHIEKKVESHVEDEHFMGIFLLVFLSVLREGIETVLFLNAAYLQASSASGQLRGAILGIAIAILMSFLLFRGMGKLSMKRCFSVTTMLLILFAAGLFAHGVHELQEAALLPIVAEHVWDINWLLNENGTVGGLLKGVFGYNGNPSLLEVGSYLIYLSGIAYLYRKQSKA